MFRKPFLVLFILSTAVGLKAQKGFRIGPSAHVLSSKPFVVDSLPDNFNFRLKSGFNIGLDFQYGFDDRFTLGWGLGYTNKGYRLFNDSNSSGDLLKHNFSSIELPISAIYKMRLGVTSRMRAVAGLTLNYQVGSTEKVLMNKNESFVIREKSLNALYPLGHLGLEIASEGKSGNVFVFGVYYKQSLVNQTELSVFNTSDVTKNRVFSLGYRGSYIGLGFSYLFDIKNFKRSEEYFY